MQVARRVYLYLISYISLWMVLAGASNLLALLVRNLLAILPDSATGAVDQREQFSLWGAMLLVGGIVWAIHWLLAQRGVAPTNPAAAEERQSALRKLFLYGALATTLWQVAFALADLLQTTLRPVAEFDYSPDPKLVWTAAGAQLLVYGLGWLYYWRVRNQDQATTPETGRAATVRRWYFYLVNYVALSVVLVQTANLAGDLWQLLTSPLRPSFVDSQWVPLPIAIALAWIVAAGGIWLWHWRTVQRLVATDTAEQRSTLRKVYLYGMTLQTVSVTLANAAFLLNSLFRLFWGTDPVAGTGETALTAAGRPLLTALVYGVFWAYHWQVLKWDGQLPVAGPAFATALRQLYHYLVALIGLGMLAGGIGDTLRLLIDRALGGSATTSLSQQQWGDQLSLVITLILVGAPVWLLSWRHVQREALASDGAAARQSLPRRLYLFVVLFATVTALLISAASLIYQVFRHLGDPIGSWASDMSWAFAATVTAGVLLAYHLSILRSDLRARLPDPPATPALPETARVSEVIVLLRGADAESVEAAIATIRHQLPRSIGVDVILAAGVNPAEITAWLAARATLPMPPVPPPLSSDPAPA
jgi:hypothetical protein